jgi:hypothetical protein
VSGLLQPNVLFIRIRPPALHRRRIVSFASPAVRDVAFRVRVDEWRLVPLSLRALDEWGRDGPGLLEG